MLFVLELSPVYCSGTCTASAQQRYSAEGSEENGTVHAQSKEKELKGLWLEEKEGESNQSCCGLQIQLHLSVSKGSSKEGHPEAMGRDLGCSSPGMGGCPTTAEPRAAQLCGTTQKQVLSIHPTAHCRRSTGAELLSLPHVLYFSN